MKRRWLDQWAIEPRQDGWYLCGVDRYRQSRVDERFLYQTGWERSPGHYLIMIVTRPGHIYVLARPGRGWVMEANS